MSAMRSLLTFAFAGLVIAGCGGPAAPKPETKKEPVVSVLAKGVEVPLILLRQIEAGSSREGLLVPFMVAEDVTDEAGQILIEKGAVAEGEVTWSRSEGSLSGLMNQPARLAVRFNRTRAAGEESVHLCADVEKPEEAFQFTRENTGRSEVEGGQSLEGALNETVAKSLNEFFTTGDPSRLDAETEARQWLIEATKAPGMEAARAYLDPEAPERASSDSLGRVVKHLQDGTITKLAAPELMLAANALSELGRLASSVDRSLSAKLKGRTIKAYAGTKVTAFVKDEVKVKVS